MMCSGRMQVHSLSGRSYSPGKVEKSVLVISPNLVGCFCSTITTSASWSGDGNDCGCVGSSFFAREMESGGVGGGGGGSL